jgi:hypothetical protein
MMITAYPHDDDSSCDRRDDTMTNLRMTDLRDDESASDKLTR